MVLCFVLFSEGASFPGPQTKRGGSPYASCGLSSFVTRMQGCLFTCLSICLQFCKAPDPSCFPFSQGGFQLKFNLSASPTFRWDRGQSVILVKHLPTSGKKWHSSCLNQFNSFFHAILVFLAKFRLPSCIGIVCVSPPSPQK